MPLLMQILMVWRTTELKIEYGYFFLGTVWVARGDSSTWAQNNPKFRPSAVSQSLGIL